MIKNATIPVETIVYDTKDEADLREKIIGNMEEIGEGCYATVYAKSKTRVVKVSACLNDSYMAYIKQVIQTKNPNPFLPRIYKLTIYKSKTNKRRGFYVVEMERLQPLGEAMDWRTKYFVVGQLEEILTEHPSAQSYLKQMQKTFHGGFIEIGKAMTLPPGLEEAVSVIKKAYKSKRGAAWDLHEYNIMLRGKQVVVTDPIS